MKNHFWRSCHKFEQNVIKEDAAAAGKRRVAVSDGAGGGGVFADRWSRYLIKNLPKKPISVFTELDEWIDGIWEAFYNEYEKEAKKRGGLFLEKFYDEGSFATLAAAWMVGANEWQWMTYGDSVVFHYIPHANKLEYSPIRLSDFDRPPYLISIKDPLQESGFHSGTFHTGDGSAVFVTSDALAHYILMMYELSKPEAFSVEINEALNAKTKNSNFILMAQTLNISFTDIMERLLDRRKNFRREMKKLLNSGLLGNDDYSLAVWQDTTGI